MGALSQIAAAVALVWRSEGLSLQLRARERSRAVVVF